MAKRSETLQMAELYRAGETLQQIGNRYGISRQTVHQRLSKLGIKREGRPVKQKLIDRTRLECLYIQDNLPLKQIAKAFRVDTQAIKTALILYNIPKRTRRGSHRSEFLKGMKVGESREISFSVNRPYKLIYTPAKKLGIRVSLRFIGDGRYEVTRIE